MSFLRKFVTEGLGKSRDAKRPAKDNSPVDADKAPSSGGLIDPLADGAKSEEHGGEKTSGGLINPFAEKGAAAAPADHNTQAKEVFEKAEALYKKHSYAKAAAQYEEAFELATADHRGVIAFNIAQSFRLSKSFPNAAVWYQKALALGGPGVSPYREEIEQRLAEMQEDTKKHPVHGADGKDLGEAQTQFEEADIAYKEHDYAKAAALYKEAYSRSNIPSILFNVAQSFRLGGKPADAKYWYREYLKLVPNSPYKAEVEGKIEELKKKVPDPPDLDSQDDGKKKFAQAQQFYEAKNYGEAGDLYVEVFFDPAVAHARGQTAFNIGQCMRLTGKTKSAVEWYKKALEYLPSDSPYRAEIAGRISELTGGKS